MFFASILTLFPEIFPGNLQYSLAGKALQDQKWGYEALALRDFGEGKHLKVDDTPTGGGAGLVMKAEPIARCFEHHIQANDNRPRIMLSPRGAPLTQQKVREYAAREGVIMLCGRFEGVDQRVLDYFAFEEVSIGDYILSGGEPAALVLLDAIIRLLPGVMGSEFSEISESHENGLLEYPHYTRPAHWRERDIPEILLSGNHGLIENWREEQSRLLTQKHRPDLYQKWLQNHVTASKKSSVKKA